MACQAWRDLGSRLGHFHHYHCFTGFEQKSFEKAGVNLKIPATDVVYVVVEGNCQRQLKIERRSVAEEKGFSFLGGIFNYIKATRKLH